MAVNWGKYNKDSKKKKAEPARKESELSPEEVEDKKIVTFDEQHVAKFPFVWKAVNNPGRDLKAGRIWQEKSTIVKISTMPEELKDKKNRGIKPHYRIVLLMDKNDKVEDVMKKTPKEFAEERKENSQKDKRDQKQEPSLAIVAANGEIEGAPVSVEKYLVATRSKSLDAIARKREDKAPLFESVYGRDNHDKTWYRCSYLENQKAFSKDKQHERNEQKVKENEQKHEKQKGKVRQISGKTAHNEIEAEELHGKLMRANDYVLGQDIAAEQALDGRTPVRDARIIETTDNLETKVQQQLSRSREGEQIRNEDPTIAPERQLEDSDRDGTPDKYEKEDKGYIDKNDNDIPNYLEFKDLDGDGKDDRIQQQEEKDEFDNPAREHGEDDWGWT